MNFSLQELEKLIQPINICGNYDGDITGIASLEYAQKGDVAFFLGKKKYRQHLEQSSASLILVPVSFSGQPHEGQIFFFVDNPSWAMAQICAIVEKRQTPSVVTGVHPSAIIDPSVKICKNVSIGPFCVIESDVIIGDGVHIGAHCVISKGCRIGSLCQLKPRVTLYGNSEIGENVIIHSGTVIGSDGFGYETIGGVHHKLSHVGRVVIENDVEIGANVTIDRARFAETRIGKGTKIDNLVQIGHNVNINENCIIVAQVGIAGSSTLGRHVVLGGQVGIAGHIYIGDEVQVAAQCGVASDVSSGNVVRGTPAMPIYEANRFFALRKHIPELFRRVENLEKKSSHGL